MRRWIVLLILAVVIYVGWRKFGPTIRGAITNVAS